MPFPSYQAPTGMHRERVDGSQFDTSATQKGLQTGSSLYAGINAMGAGKGLWGGMAMSYYNVPSLLLTKFNPKQQAAQMRADANFVRHIR